MAKRAAGDGLIRFGVFEANLQTGELRKHGLKIKLREQPFQILSLLLENPGRVVSREELQRRLWPTDTFVDFDHGLNRAVNQLRDALDDSVESPRFVETLPKRGYRFVADVDIPQASEKPVADKLPSAAAAASAPAMVASATKTHPRARIWLVAGVALLLVGVAVAWIFGRRVNALTEPNIIVLTEIDNLTGDPAFDSTIKQGLQIDLEQSPFLRILSEQQLVDIARLMGRSADLRLTMQTAREICLRAGGKAVLSGSVARLGSEYVVNLNAVNCETGEALGQEQVRAKAKEEVLQGLDKAAADLRGKLGESLSSIRRFDRPLSDFGVSTASLEAFQAYANGQKMVDRKGRPYGIPFFRRAADLDPNFGLAYMQLGILYGHLGEARLSAEYTSKAYALRDHVSESEGFFISVQYYLQVSEQPEKVPPVCQIWFQSYPRDRVGHDRAGWAYTVLGQYENALAEEQQAYRMRGDVAVTVNGLARSYLFLDRLQDARAVFQKALAQNPDQLFWRQGMYLLAFLDGDMKSMEDQVTWAMSRPGTEDHLLSMHSDTNAYFGRLGKARELSRQAAEFAQRSEFKERAAGLLAREAVWEAWLGDSEAASQQARAALSMVPGRDVRALAALALARAGDASKARDLEDQLDAEFPSSTLIHGYWLPAIRAEIEMHSGNYDRAVELLRAAAPYDLADTPSPLIPVYIRAEALLRAGKGGAAAAEFRKLLNHRGIMGNSPMGALGNLGLARAYAVSGETTKARNKYEDFFNLWKDADFDIPVLKQAQAEYKKVN